MIVTNIVFYVSSHVNIQNKCVKCPTEDDDGIFYLRRLPGNAEEKCGRQALPSVQGLLVPVVDSPSAFDEFARKCFYPPHGTRGTALGRFNRWGDDFETYRATFQPVLVPMIETRRGVEAAAEIASLDHVDALFFGPYDLSADLGDGGNFSASEFIAARAQILEAAQKSGKACGGHQVEPAPENLSAMIEDGFRFIAYGTDVVALRASMATFKTTI